MKNLNSRGIALMEVMVALVIVGIIAFGLTTFIDNSIASQNAVTFKGQVDQLTNEIRTTLGHPTACANTFNNGAPGAVSLTAALDSLRTEIRDKTNAVVYSTGSIYGDKFVTLTSMRAGGTIDPADTYVTITGNEGQFQLTLQYTSTRRTLGPNTLARRIIISTVKDGSNNLTHCYAKAGGADSLWTALGTSGIYYSGGIVGVGTASPVGQLHVQSSIVRDGGWHSALEIQTNGAANLPSVIFSGQTTSQYSAILWTGSTSGNTANKIGASILALPTTATNTNLQFSTNNAVSSSNSSVKMTLTGAGNLGVGTTAPASLVEVRKDTVGGLGPTLNLSNFGGGAGAGVSIDFLGAGTQNVHNRIQSVDDGAFSSHLVFSVKTTGATGNALSEKMRLTSSGNLGIGIVLPTAQVHLHNTSRGGDLGIGQQNDSTPYMRLGMDTGWVQYLANNAYWTGSAYNFVATGGYGGTASRIAQVSGTIQFDTVSGGTNPITWNNRLYIANNGNIGIGMTTPAYPLDVNGIVRAGSFLSTSDERAKRDIATSEGLNEVMKLRGVKFNWRQDGRPSRGVIAQEVEKVFPELVFTAVDGRKSVNYEGLMGPMIESVKELEQRCEMSDRQNLDLQRRIMSLEEMVWKLSRRIEELENRR